MDSSRIKNFSVGGVISYDFRVYTPGYTLDIGHFDYGKYSKYQIRLIEHPDTSLAQENYNCTFDELVEAIKGIETNKTLKGALKQATQQLLDMQDELAKEKYLHDLHRHTR